MSHGVMGLKALKSSLLPVAVLIILSLLFLLLSFISYYRLSNMASTFACNNPRTIIVDAGHGGEDGGATGKSAVPEKDINLAIALDLQQLLQASGYHVVMTRTTDISISDNLDTVHERKVSDLNNRLKLVQAQGSGSIFVSIHQNCFPQSQYSGAQVFYSVNDNHSKVIAESIRSRIVELLQKDNKRETKPATSSIFLLWNIKTPAVLVECGFLSNSAEAQKLNDKTYQQQIAFAIFSGLLDYCNPSES